MDNYEKYIRALKKAKRYVASDSNKVFITKLLTAFEAFNGLPLPMYTEHKALLVRALRDISEFEYSYKGASLPGELLTLSLEL